MSVINIKAGKQDDIRPNRPDNMDNHPVLPKYAHHPRFLTKSSGPIATERQPIPDQSNEEEVGVCRPALSRQESGRQEHQGVGPQIAYSPTGMAPPAFGRTESHDPNDHRRQSCPHMDNE